jgi:hypothetical protein
MGPCVESNCEVAETLNGEHPGSAAVALKLGSYEGNRFSWRTVGCATNLLSAT